MNRGNIFRLSLVTGIIVIAAITGFSSQPKAEDKSAVQSTPEYPVLRDESDTVKIAKQTLDDLVNNYEQELEFAFFQNVSDRYLREYLDFKRNIENDFRAFDNIRINYWIDDEEAEGDTVSITIHWNRSVLPNMGGTPVLTTGQSKMLIEVKDGKGYLVDQTGDVLFGLVPTP